MGHSEGWRPRGHDRSEPLPHRPRLQIHLGQRQDGGGVLHRIHRWNGECGRIKETKFESGASTRQLFMLWSHNVGEARYERCVTCLDMLAQSGVSLFSFIQLALWNRKIYLFSSEHMFLAYTFFLSSLSNNDFSC